MTNDAYLDLKKALEASNKENTETFKGFTKKLNEIESEVKNILQIVEGNPQVPTQLGLAKEVFNNKESINHLKSMNIEKRLTTNEDDIKKFKILYYKGVGLTSGIMFILGFIIRYIEKNLS
jgi:hypothetical protein